MEFPLFVNNQTCYSFTMYSKVACSATFNYSFITMGSTHHVRRWGVERGDCTIWFELGPCVCVDHRNECLILFVCCEWRGVEISFQGRGSGRRGPDPEFPLVFHKNSASRTFFITIPNPLFLTQKNTLKSLISTKANKCKMQIGSFN